MLRPLIVQYYRRGRKSLGCRHFSSSHCNKNDVEYVERTVMEYIFNLGFGLAYGFGSGALLVRIFSHSNFREAKEIEREWEVKQQYLAEIESILEWKRKCYGITSSAK